MEKDKEQKNIGYDLRKFEELQQKSLTLLKISAYFTNIVVQSLSESNIAKSVASSYLETSLSTLDITLSPSLSRKRRSGTSSYGNLRAHRFTFNDT